MTMNEHSPGPLLKALLAHTRTALTSVGEFWNNDDTQDSPIEVDSLQEKMDRMLEPESAEALLSANTLFRALVRTQLIVTIISELHSPDTYTSRQPSTQLLSTLKSPEEIKTIHDLCALQRACVLSNIRLKATMPSAHRNALGVGATPPMASQPSSDVTMDQAISATTTAATVSREPAAEPQLNSKWPDAKGKNAKALKQVLSSIPESFKMFLQGMLFSLAPACRASQD